MIAIVGLFFFLSGMTGLILETVWFRELHLIFGSSTLAMGTVTGAFLGGLGLGGLLYSLIEKKIKRKLVAYGILEAAIGIMALAMPTILYWLNDFQHQWSGGLLYNAWAYSTLRFIVIFLALCIPTACMGATLPLLLSATTKTDQGIGSRAGFLYGINTFGGVAGALLAGFHLLPSLGITQTTQLAVSLCFFTAAGITVADLLLKLEVKPEDVEAPPSTKRPLRPYKLLGFFLLSQGFIALTLQVCMARIVGIVLGSSVYSFTLVLVVFLLGIALGSLVYGLYIKEKFDQYKILGWTQVLLVIGLGFTFFMADEAPELLLVAAKNDWLEPAFLFPIHALVIAALLIIPTISLGISFPLAIRLFSGRVDEVGRSTGIGVFLNTVGSILGSFLAAFVLIPKIGLNRTIMLIASLVLLWAFFFSLVQNGFLVISRAKRSAPWLAVAIIALVLVPQWDVSKLAAGYFRVAVARSLAQTTETLPPPIILFHKDGPSATVTLERRENVLTLKANGRPEASNRFDMPTQIMAGLFPILAHPKESGWDTALIGYGSGITAGAMLQSELKSLLVVELEPRIVEAATYFDSLNHRPLIDQRTTLIEGDARTVLGYWPSRFDIIVSEPSNPWVSGSGNLFTQDFYKMMSGKLKEGGIYAQWVQLYEMSPEHLAILLRTFRSVFPHVQVLASLDRGVDLIVLGSNAPILFDIESMHRRNTEKVSKELRRAGIASPEGAVALLKITDDQLVDFVGSGEINTDDNGLIEFAGPLDAMRNKIFLERVVQFHFQTDKISILPTLVGLGETNDEKAKTLARLSLELLTRGRADAAYETALEGLKFAQNETLKEVVEVSEWIYAEPAKWPPIPDGWLVEKHSDKQEAGNLVLLMLGEQWKDAYGLAVELQKSIKDPRLTYILGSLALRLNLFKDAIAYLEPLAKDQEFIRQNGAVNFYLGRAYDRNLNSRKAIRALATFNAWAKDHPEEVEPVDSNVILEEVEEPIDE